LGLQDLVQFRVLLAGDLATDCMFLFHMGHAT
jgi:hypothetical protein